MKHIAVVGGGVAGLASAILLAHRGCHVTVLEKQSQVGGRAGLHREAGFTFDTGPSWYLMPEVFERFFALVGHRITDHLDLITLNPGYRVFGHGLLETNPFENTPTTFTNTGNSAKHLDIPFGRDHVRAVFESLEPGSGPAFDRYVDSAVRTYNLATHHFLYTLFQNPAEFIRPHVLANLPHLPQLFGTSMARHTARYFRHPLLRQILGYPAVFLGTEPRRAPALFHLMSKLDLVDGVRYPQGGMYQLVAALEQMARSFGVTIRTDAEAVHLVADSHVEQIIARTHRGLEEFNVDAVIAANDLHHFDSLLPAKHRVRTFRQWHRQDPGIGALTLLLGVRGRIGNLAHHNLFFTGNWDTNFDDIFVDQRLPEPASAYVCAPSKTDGSVAPAGTENLFVLVPAPANRTLRAGQTTVENYANRIIESLGAAVGKPDLRDRLLVRKVTAPGDFTHRFHAFNGTALGPANTLFQSAMFRHPVRSRTLENLVYTGAFTAPGVGLPMCLISAENAVHALLGTQPTLPVA